jgi:alpha-L-rhamnosidase
VSTQPLVPMGLRCAHHVNPLGVAPDRVRLSWLLDGAGDGRRQTSYRVQVVQDAASFGGADMAWDSGRRESGESIDVAYEGEPLTRGDRYEWRVRVWDESQIASDWSEPACFEVELDPSGGWQARWIRPGRHPGDFTPPAERGPLDPLAHALAPVPYLRRSFTVTGPVASARLYVTALGLYEARLNGSKVSDAVLTPGWTDYSRRIPYQTYDVSALLQRGENVLGAMLGDGWYSGFVGFNAKHAGAHYGAAPELLAQLIITMTEGSTRCIGTDGKWRTKLGGLRHADLLMGERQDRGLEPAGWDAPGFDATEWRAVVCRDLDDPSLVADPGPPIRVTQELAPRSIRSDEAGRHIIDFGQNLTGWLKMRVAAPAGTRIRVRHGEVLTNDGGLHTENLRTARQADEFTTAGGTEVLEPHFTIHGFRYAEVSGYPGEPEPADIAARVAHSDVALTGSFECDQPWLNQLFRNIDWGQRGNFISVPTDCPQRDERLGWLGDAQIFARTACYNRDVAAFFAKWLDDVADAQLPHGAFSDVAPRLDITWSGAPAWGDAGVIVPWTVYKMYGDRGILRRHFGAMSAWMDFIARDNPDCLRSQSLGNSYNDWLAPGDDNTPHELLATAYWAYDALLMAEMAAAIDRPADADKYRELWSKIRAAFTDAFVAADGRMKSGTQTAYVLGLHMGLVPDDLRAAAATHLVGAIRAADFHLTTGFVGVGYLLPVLSSVGQTDLAYALLEQESRPSWRYMLNHGATTIWERWDGWSPEHGFQSPQMNSFNHYALGSVGEWLYRFVLGIDQAPGAAAFDRLVLRPHPGGSLTSASGSYQSVRGRIESDWQIRAGEFILQISVPPNVTASVRVPSSTPADVRDGDGSPPIAIADFPGALGVGEAVFEVGSGGHRFTGAAIAHTRPHDGVSVR